MEKGRNAGGERQRQERPPGRRVDTLRDLEVVAVEVEQAVPEEAGGAEEGDAGEDDGPLGAPGDAQAPVLGAGLGQVRTAGRDNQECRRGGRHGGDTKERGPPLADDEDTAHGQGGTDGRHLAGHPVDADGAADPPGEQFADQRIGGDEVGSAGGTHQERSDREVEPRAGDGREGRGGDKQSSRRRDDAVAGDVREQVAGRHPRGRAAQPSGARDDAERRRRDAEVGGDGLDQRRKDDPCEVD